MVEHVETRLKELREGLVGSGVRVLEDGSGGAFVIVDNIEIGDHFAPSRTWIGFHITWADEDADVYPYFIDAGVRYVGDGAAPVEHPSGNLPAAMGRGGQMPGFDLPAITISRRSNRRNPETDSPLQKLLRIIEFLRTR
jgi:hypothetical protein